MLQLQRQEDLLRLLEQKREMTVKELCAALYCSPATVRRDLEDLQRRGRLRRSFGGAVYQERYPDQLPLALRSAAHISEKKRLCARAAALIRPGDTVLIDASSTTYFLAPWLKEIPEVTVVTNNPYLTVVLAETGVRCLCTGGETLSSSLALTGSDAERFVRGVRANLFFFSARGVCRGEITDSSKGERDLKRAMIERSEKSCFLSDESKEGLCFAYRVADTAECQWIRQEPEPQ